MKKGMYFTIMTIAFLAIFLFIFMIPSYQPFSKKMNVVEMRVNSMDDFLKDITRDTERALYISSYRGLLALEQEIVSKGEYLDDTETRFKEAILNGTIHNVSSDIMQLSTFQDWIDKIEQESTKFNINTTILVNDIEVYQKDPWNIMVRANITMMLNDTTNIASWLTDREVETSISIISFEDPIYTIASLGRVINKINITPYEGDYVDGQNVTNFLDHIEKSYYAANPNSPSFLMRLENNMSSSLYGIESLIYIPNLVEQELVINSQSSIVDYHYWNGVSNGDYGINNTPSWVKIDQNHLSKYDLEDVSY
ncbi:hypothetical protein ACFLZX_02805 [Nanoarchaeota archaeon]